MKFSNTALPFLAALIGLAVIPAAQAQTLPSPKLTHIAPLGGQVGTSFELTLTGSEFDDAEGLHFSFAGAEVEVLGAAQPLNPADMKKKGGGAKAGGGA